MGGWNITPTGGGGFHASPDGGGGEGCFIAIVVVAAMFLVPGLVTYAIAELTGQYLFAYYLWAALEVAIFLWILWFLFKGRRK